MRVLNYLPRNNENELKTMRKIKKPLKILNEVKYFLIVRNKVLLHEQKKI